MINNFFIKNGYFFKTKMSVKAALLLHFENLFNVRLNRKVAQFSCLCAFHSACCKMLFWLK